MCLKRLKIFCTVLALLLLVSLPIFSLDAQEAEELTQILTELNSGLTKVERGLNEISDAQKRQEKELNVLHNKTKELETESEKQKKELAKLEAQLQNWQDLYNETQAENRRLKWMLGGSSALAAVALIVAAF